MSGHGFDWSNYYAITKAGEASSKADQAKFKADLFEDRLDRIFLVCEAMWELLKRKTGTTEEELARMVEEIDLSDGKLDGKKRVKVRSCAECGKTLSIKHRRCLYCGAAVQPDKAFP